MIVDAVTRAVAEVLAAQRDGRPLGAVSGTDDPLGVVDAICRHRVETVLAPSVAASAVSAASAASGFGVDAERVLDEAALVAMGAGMRNALHTDRVSRLLAAAGIEHLVVKGAALAALLGQPAGARGGGDVDVWVAPGDVGAAERVLAEHGWHRRATGARLPHAGGGWRWRLFVRLGHEIALDHPTGSTVDLHWALCADRGELSFGFAEAMAASVLLDSIGPTVRTLCRLHALEHVAQHGRKEEWPVLRQVVDVVQLAELCPSNEVTELARRSANVRLALAVAANLGSNVDRNGEPVRTGRRIELAARRAWAGCLALDRPLGVRRSLTGWPKVRDRVRHEWWLVWSAPTVGVAIRHLMRLAVPLRLVVEGSSRPG